jgi:hypothetical protein
MRRLCRAAEVDPRATPAVSVAFSEPLFGLARKSLAHHLIDIGSSFAAADRPDGRRAGFALTGRVRSLKALFLSGERVSARRPSGVASDQSFDQQPSRRDLSDEMPRAEGELGAPAASGPDVSRRRALLRPGRPKAHATHRAPAPTPCFIIS